MVEVLFPKIRSRILALLLLNQAEEFYLSRIIRRIGMGRGAVQRELESLTRGMVIERERKGHQVFYKANTNHPAYKELRMLMVKTFGLRESIREALRPISGKVKVAFIYGSVAKGVDDADSDVDLLVIGDVTFGEVIDAIKELEQNLGREISPLVYSLKEFKRKIKDGHHFTRSVVGGEKIFVEGTEDELRKIIG